LGGGKRLRPEATTWKKQEGRQAPKKKKKSEGCVLSGREGGKVVWKTGKGSGVGTTGNTIKTQSSKKHTEKEEKIYILFGGGPSLPGLELGKNSGVRGKEKIYEGAESS